MAEGESSVFEGERQGVHVLFPRVLLILAFHAWVDYIALQGLVRQKYYTVILFKQGVLYRHITSLL